MMNVCCWTLLIGVTFALLAQSKNDDGVGVFVKAENNRDRSEMSRHNSQIVRDKHYFETRSQLWQKRRQEVAEKIKEMHERGVDHVSHTAEAAELRRYKLRKKKLGGLLGTREKSLAEVLFPGVSPVEYLDNHPIQIVTDFVNSKKTQVPFEFYDLPVCEPPRQAQWGPEEEREKRSHYRKNLGSRLQGVEWKPAPFPLRVKHNVTCTPLCQIQIGGKRLRWMRKLIQRQYRVYLTLDQLPVLMRSKQLNYAVRGYPIGFQSSPTKGSDVEIFLYNHFKFIITYQESPSEYTGVRITGFDVTPVSYAYKVADDWAMENNKPLDSCNAPGAVPLVNNPNTYLPLRTGTKGQDLKILYSYQVEWQKSDLAWADRWDVYLIGSPDDDIHYFAIVNSLMIILFLTGAIATIMVKTLRNDIAGYNEAFLQQKALSLEEVHEETGWKLVHGDVFRPPSFHPIWLCVLVGTGAQIGVALFGSLACAVLHLLNPLKKGQTLTAILLLYVLSGSIAGYVACRLYKFYKGPHWKLVALYTAMSLPSMLVGLFLILNICLHFAGAATAVSFWIILILFSLWVCVSVPLVLIGSYIGQLQSAWSIPTRIHSISRSIPKQHHDTFACWYTKPPMSCLLGGILPFGSVCIELFFIMSALWLHQMYYVMGFLFAVLFIAALTCAEVAIVLCYLQLCFEDHRWWWKAFGNCASAGFYLFVYSLWFLSNRLELVGILPVMVYLTYMSMISVAFGLFCGSVGVLVCLWFTKTIYGALKVD